MSHRYRTINPTTQAFLEAEGPVAYAHLIKFERPSRPNAVTGEVSTSAERYAYLTDGSINISFDDGSTDNAGNANGSQVYIANRVQKVGSIKEASKAEASSSNLVLMAQGLGAAYAGGLSLTTSSKTITADTSLVEANFREGDKFSLYNGSTLVGVFNIVRFPTEKSIVVSEIDDTFPASDPTYASGSLMLESDEIKSILLDKTASDYATFVNREVYIYKAFLDPDNNNTVVGDPLLIFKGIISNVNYNESDTNATVTWGLTSHWGDFVQVNGRITSDEYHRGIDYLGQPSPDSSIKPQYAYDKGFMHAEQSIAIEAIYQVLVEKQKLKKKKNWIGYSKVKVKTYFEEEDREVDLAIDLQGKSLPVIYGVRKVGGIPIFADTRENDQDEVYVASAICEGEIAGIYDLVIEGNSLICKNSKDATSRASANNPPLVCRGRADLGDVLLSSDFKTNIYYNFYTDATWNVRSFYYGFTTTGGSTTATGTAGVVHGETIRMTSPQAIYLDLFTGKEDQEASDRLVNIARHATNQFKLQVDYWDEAEKGEYWGSNHKLLDTAYVVGKYTIAAGETSIPEIEYIVRGKLVDCYNYDYTYEHNPLYPSETLTAFSLGELVDIYDASDNLIETSAQIIDLFSFVNIDGTINSRVKLDKVPPLNYVDGIPAITEFYIKGKNSSLKWHMVTYNHVEEGPSTVPGFISADISTVTDSSNDTILTKSNTVNISAISKANPCVVTTSAAHGLSDSNLVAIIGAGGMEEINKRAFYVDVLTTTTFALYRDSGLTSAVNSTAYTTYTSGGYVDKDVYLAVGGEYEEQSPVYSIVRANKAPFQGYLKKFAGVSSTAGGLFTNLKLKLKYKDFDSQEEPGAYLNTYKASGDSSLKPIIVSSNTIRLASTASTVDDYYVGFDIKVKRLDTTTGKTNIQTKSIKSYDGVAKVVTIEGIWQDDFIPDAGDTYEIIPKLRDKRTTINPAMQILDYMSSDRYGKGLHVEDHFYLEDWTEAGRECDKVSDVVIRLDSAETVTPVVGEYYRYPYFGYPLFQGRVTNVESKNGTKYISFTDVIGKITNKWNNRTNYVVDQLVYYKDNLYRVVADGVTTTAPTHTSGTVGSFEYLSAVELYKGKAGYTEDQNVLLGTTITTDSGDTSVNTWTWLTTSGWWNVTAYMLACGYDAADLKDYYDYSSGFGSIGTATFTDASSNSQTIAGIYTVMDSWNSTYRNSALGIYTLVFSLNGNQSTTPGDVFTSIKLNGRTYYASDATTEYDAINDGTSWVWEISAGDLLDVSSVYSLSINDTNPAIPTTSSPNLTDDSFISDTTGVGASRSYSVTLTEDVDSDDMLFLCIHTSTSAAVRTINSITFDGTAGTSVTGAQSTSGWNSRADIYRWPSADLPSNAGTYTLAVTFSGDPDQVHIQVVKATGISQTGSVADTDSDTDLSWLSGVDLTATIQGTILPNDYGIIFATSDEPPVGDADTDVMSINPDSDGDGYKFKQESGANMSLATFYVNTVPTSLTNYTISHTNTTANGIALSVVLNTAAIKKVDVYTSGNCVQDFDTTLNLEASGYSLYDSDGVIYWKYLGWEAPQQRWATRHQLNMIVDTSAPMFDNINSMLAQCNGILTYTGGKYSISIEAEAPIITSTDLTYITEDDIIGNITISDTGIKNAYNSISVSYSDPAENFETKTINFFNSTYLKQDKNVPRKGNFAIPSVTNYYNARLLAETYLTQSRFGMNIRMRLTPKHIALLPGMIISVSRDRYNWSEKLFRIESLIINDDCTVDIVASEHDDSIYAFTL